MKQRLSIYILLAILSAASVNAFLIGGYSHKLLSLLLDRIKQDAFAQVQGKLNMFDRTLLALEGDMEKIGEQAMSGISASLTSPLIRTSLTPGELKHLALSQGVDDITLIASSGIIYNGSFEPDLKLNLQNISPTFTGFLKSVYGSGKIVHQRISISSLTGVIRKFIYFSPAGSDEIIQLSINIRPFISRRFGFQFEKYIFHDMFSEFLQSNHFVNDIDIFHLNNLGRWSIVHEGRQLDVPANLLAQLLDKTLVEITRDHDENGSRHSIVYRHLSQEGSSSKLTLTSLARIEFDFSLLDQFIQFALFSFIIGTLFVAALFFALFSKLINRKFIERIIKVEEGLSRIGEGDYSLRLAKEGNDEISSIVVRVNQMAEEIGRRNEDLLSSHRAIEVLRNHLSKILASLSCAVIAVDRECRITIANQAASRFFGLPPENAYGLQLWKALPLLAEYEGMISEPAGGFHVCSFLRRKLFPDQDRWFNLAFNPLSADDQGGFVMRIDEITELMHQTEQLQQAQKMEMIGILAGGMAHDFNNFLAVIVATSSLLQTMLDSSTPQDPQLLTRHLDSIKQAGMHATEIVNRLLTLSHKQTFALEPLSLTSLLIELKSIIESSFPKSIRILFNLPDAPAFIHGNATHLHQVLLNICLNSNHAMTIMRAPGEKLGGVLTLTLSRCDTKTALDADLTGQPFGSFWCIEVKDTGVGVSENNLRKLLTPFFTTKPKGTGTGLGLPVAYGLMEQHRGFLRFSSVLGQGTAVRIYLPCNDTELPPADAPSHETAEPSLPAGNHLVLVIDDDPLIRETVSLILTTYGYQVIEARNGQEGIDQFRLNHARLAAVVLDLIMPEMSGDIAFHQLRQISRTVPILVSSGFQMDPRVQELLKSGAAGFLGKPYDAARLVNLIQQISKPLSGL